MDSNSPVGNNSQELLEYDYATGVTPVSEQGLAFSQFGWFIPHTYNS